MAEQTVRSSMLLEARSPRRRSIEVPDEEIEEELKKMAEQYQMELEKVKDAVRHRGRPRRAEDRREEGRRSCIADSADG